MTRFITILVVLGTCWTRAEAAACSVTDSSPNYVSAESDLPLPQICDEPGRCRMYDLDGRRVGEIGDFQLPNGFSEGLVAVWVSKTQLHGYMDRAGRWVIAPQYRAAQPFCEGRAAVRLADGQWTYIDASGARVGGVWDSAETFAEGRGLVGVSSNGETRYGFVDLTGKLIAPARFSSARLYSEGYAAVRLGEEWKWGYIDRDGRIVIEPQFVEARYFHAGRAVVRIPPAGPQIVPQVDMNRAYLGPDPKGSPNAGLIDAAGRFVVEPRYDEIYNLSGSDRWVVVEPQRLDRGDTRSQSAPPMRIADREGRLADDRFDDIRVPTEGLIEVCRDEKCGFADTAGKIVVPLRFKHVGSFSEGLASATLDGEKYGYIDHSGGFVIQPRFTGYGGPYSENYGVGEFSEGVAPVGCRGLSGYFWGYIDKTGAWVVPPLYRHAESFANGFAQVSLPSSDDRIPMLHGHIRRDGAPIDFDRKSVGRGPSTRTPCGAPIAKDAGKR